MAIVNVILSIVLVNFMSYDFVLTQNINDLNIGASSHNIGEFLGKWYYVAVIKRVFDWSLRCIEHIVMKGKNNDLLIKWSGMDMTGHIIREELTGIINNSELSLTWSNNSPTLHSIETHNHGNEIILCQKPNADICSILSRYSTISKKSRRNYEKLAKHRKMRLSYITHEHCEESEE